MKITVYFDKTSGDLLDKLAQHLSRSRSNTIRWLIAQEFTRQNLQLKPFPALEEYDAPLDVGLEQKS